ncbi:hypothetical protein Pint_25488 [Pistacia integerrima]|uniref:Uncharacterized protein n=1 Tax=Pistacia integerrima TaxID=434235 RepID=A0ACC0YG08_9ROSI|nr:hypothetical protein Pint_25488 [Pistacia integerrima]
MPKLPRDIIADILSRVPIKCLMQFKCVCKDWYALVSDPQFAKMQLKQARADITTNVHRLFLTTCPLQTIDYEAFGDGDSSNLSRQLAYPTRSNPVYDAEILGSCNGLVFLEFDYDNLFLLNPTTRDSRELPQPDTTSTEKDSIFYGLGYDVYVDDYKVIRGVISAASNGPSSRDAKVEVLELKTNTWRRIQYPHSSINIDGRGILLNGTLHWLGTRKSDSGNNYACVIISFDITEERFEEFVPLKDYIDQNITGLDLKISGDKLVLFFDREEKYFEAWEMKEYGVKESWTRLFSVSSETFPLHEYSLTAVGFRKDGKLLLDFDGRELAVLNTEEETLRKFIIHDDWDWFKAGIYEESLVSPNVIVDYEALWLNQSEDANGKGENSTEEVRETNYHNCSRPGHMQYNLA